MVTLLGCIIGFSTFIVAISVHGAGHPWLAAGHVLVVATAMGSMAWIDLRDR